MAGIVDAGAFLFGQDLAVEIGGHPLEIGDHGLDLNHMPATFVDLEAFQADERFTRLHGLDTGMRQIAFEIGTTAGCS
ncbi:hypothetical protein BLTE_03540 [Blastochloris tepida]|uniref:Uncharacterized protein n=1 Tax=Blastochloris tepida TaxID=2233851 RepID=A0A348FWI6_9HYPH|nr:hypothetical protein BLTE_03540 [Blastochloris tepida]